jgi:hypothetical protein
LSGQFRPLRLASLLDWSAWSRHAHLLSAMLFETAPFDPTIFIAATGLFVLVALLAAFLPARRATKVDPMVTRRCE